MNPLRMAWLGLCLSAGGFATLAGCSSSVPPPNDQWAAANEQIGRATATAPAVPDAKLHLQLAQEDLQKSKALIGSDNQRATTLIALANTEARLAEALASAAAAQEAAQKIQAQLQSAQPIGASNLQAPNTTAPPPNPPAPAAAPVGK